MNTKHNTYFHKGVFYMNRTLNEINAKNPGLRIYSTRSSKMDGYGRVLHMAPCHVYDNEGFKVSVILPRETNQALGFFPDGTGESRLLKGKNKWVLGNLNQELYYPAILGEPINLNVLEQIETGKD